MHEYLLFLIIGGVLAASLFVAHVAGRLGVPSLVAFLILGMLLGSDGIGHINFENTELARTVGVAGLVAILFEGGLSTSWRRMREVAVPAVALSTIGVVVTAALTGVAAHALFHLSWLQALLLGSVVSSTDAAAVFAKLRYTQIRRHLARTLEAETGGNDPVAIALTIGLISWIQQPAYGISDIAILLLHQLGIGLLVGIGFGAAAMWGFARLPRSVGAFAPVASVAACALSFGAAGVLGGSGFLAVYLVGLAIGSTPSRYRSHLTTFHEGLAFLAQVAMFVVLGLLVAPHELLPLAGASILLAILLVLVIRPIAVWLAIPFGRFTWRDRAMLGWAGLRGAVPIVLGTVVLSSHIPGGTLLFNIVFFVVIVSALIQGTTLEWMAERLGVADKLPPAVQRQAQATTAGHMEFVVMLRHAIVGSSISELGLPKTLRLARIKRGSRSIALDRAAIIKTGDRLFVTVPQELEPEAEDVFTRWRRRV